MVDDVPVPQRDPAVGIDPLDVVHDAGKVTFFDEDGNRVESTAYVFLSNVR